MKEYKSAFGVIESEGNKPEDFNFDTVNTFGPMHGGLDDFMNDEFAYEGWELFQSHVTEKFFLLIFQREKKV